MKTLLSQPWINLAALERAAGLTRGCLEHYVSGRRGLSKKQAARLQAYLESIKISPYLESFHYITIFFLTFHFI